jgi:hypothetical protein
MLLSAGFGGSNRRWMTNLTVDPQLFHQLQKPLHRSGRFDAYSYRTGKSRIKLPHALAFVRQSLVHNFSRRGIQHRQRLLASMQITSYNPHLGLLRSEHCWGEHRTVYSARSEADVVMTSINQDLSAALPSWRPYFDGGVELGFAARRLRMMPRKAITFVSVGQDMTLFRSPVHQARSLGT